MIDVFLTALDWKNIQRALEIARDSVVTRDSHDTFADLKLQIEAQTGITADS